MPQSRTSCLPAEGTVENAAMIFFQRSRCREERALLARFNNTFSSALPTTPTGRHMYFRVMNVKFLCLLCEIPHPEGSYESWPVAGLINNERPGLGQTENKCHRARLSSHCSKKKKHTQPLAIQVGSCVLGDALKRQNWHFTMHTNTSLTTKRNDKHITDFTGI